jgi:hypothetical protein
MITHADAVEILRFAALENLAIADFEAARARGDGVAMTDAARRWERDENYLD